MPTLLSPTDHRRVRWKNGLGWTTELAVEPAQGEFDWRISIAEVDMDCEFSVFPGIERSLLVLEGEGMELFVGDRPGVRLRADGEPLAFPGDLPAHARLLAGPTRDFNVMTRRGVVEHRLERRTIAGSLELARGPELEWFAYLERGSLELDGLRVAPGESARVEPATSATSLIVRGSGVLVLVRLRALGRATS
ncbi:HutD family protein [Nannocystaceae bacterium ST9]